MIGSFRSVAWSQGSSTGLERVKSWTLDRNFDQTEGERLLNAGNYAPAEAHLFRAVVDAETRQRSAAKRVSLRILLAEAQRGQFRAQDEEPKFAKLTSAEATVRAAIEIAAANADRALYIQCLDALAEIFTDQQNFAAVERVMQDAIKLEAALARPDPLRMGRRVLRLGVAKHRQGKAEEALPALEKAVAISEETLGPEHEETANHLTALGAVHRAMGNHEAAQKLLRRALRVHEQKGLDAPLAIADLHHLAGSLEESGDLDGAAAEYERALAYKHRVIGSDLEDLAELQYGLASLYVEWGNFARARELLYEAIGTFRRRGGLRLCVSYETMAHIEECSGRYSDAVKELASAGKAWEQLNPPRTADLIRNIERRVELLDMLRKRSEAEHLRERIARLQAVLEEQKQKEELELAQWPLDGELSGEELESMQEGSPEIDDELLQEVLDAEPAEHAANQLLSLSNGVAGSDAVVVVDPDFDSDANDDAEATEEQHSSEDMTEVLLSHYRERRAQQPPDTPRVSMPRVTPTE
ncbi:MAG: tetratricopeptide repeat protein [Bryobacteraceae bacterium]